MQNPITRIATAASLLGVDVWTVIHFLRSLRSSAPVKVIGSVDLHPPFFLLLVCIAIPVSVGVSAGLFWSQLRRVSPRNRFHDLAPDIRALNNAADDAGADYWLALSGQGRTIERLFTLGQRLNKLGIPTPRAGDHEAWMMWLPMLAAYAETRNLRAARTIPLPNSTEPTPPPHYLWSMRYWTTARDMRKWRERYASRLL